MREVSVLVSGTGRQGQSRAQCPGTGVCPIIKTTLISNQERFPFLRELGIQETNSGASPGPDYWSGTRDRELLPVVTPIDGSVIPRVALAPESDYEHVVKTAQENFLKWRMTRAPVRGQVVREKTRLRHLWWNRQHLIAEF